jgi:hypothetical protein
MDYSQTPIQFNSMRTKEFQEPKVGIFWCYQNCLFAVFTQRPEDANSTDISIDSTFSHWHEWQVLEKEGRLESLPEELRSEYDSIPRGRVLYKKKEEHFVILHGSSFTKKIQEQIIQAFHLPVEDTVDDWDEHYDPLPEDVSFY